MSRSPADTYRASTFGKRPVTVIDGRPRSGMLEALDRVGLGSAFGLSFGVMALIVVANWWMG
jgi:hypothetical protein